MLNKSKIKVYLVNINDLDNNYKGLSDEEFVDITKRVGKIYPLRMFEECFNQCIVDTNTDVIRFIGE